MARKSTESPTSETRPLWIPPGLKIDTLAPGLQFAIKEIINPVYDELVLSAPNAFERSIGLSYVHLAWLELIEQIEFGRALELDLPKGRGTEGHQDRIGRYLHVVTTKDKVAKFLLEVQKFYERVGETDPLRRVPR
jgi:hypothetical protein